MPVIHHLKTQPVYFDAVERGDKPFEIRLDDRGFQRGDIVRLLRLDPDGEGFTLRAGGRGNFTNPRVTSFAAEAHSIDRRITWILTDGFPGLMHGYVALGLAPVAIPEHPDHG